MHLQAGTLLQGGKYKIEKVLGQGGFGITYLATQEFFDRHVCIKEFFFKDYCERGSQGEVTSCTISNKDLVNRFLNKFIKEARTISRLEHPNIVRILDIFQENGTAYYAMEYIDGCSLADKVNAQGALSEAVAVDYIKQVADALDCIHQRSINHLDVKPANIMVRQSDNKAILIDFGLSKQYDEQGGQTSTTPVGISHGYAPMEQYNQGGVSTFSPQTDIYALGATLYKLVTGSTPPQAIEVFNEGLTGLPQSLSPNLEFAIKKAMQPRRNDRPQSIEAFLALLHVPATPVAKEEVRDEEETVVIEESPSISPRGGRTPNIAEEGTANKQTKEDCPALSPLQGGVPVGGGGLNGTSAESETSKRSAEKQFSPKKLLWSLLICLVAVVAFFGVRAYSNHRAEVARLAAIEQQKLVLRYRLDSIAQVKEATRLAAEAVRQEQLRKDSIAKAEEAKRLAEEKRKEEERIKTEKAKKTQFTGVINGHEWVDLGLSVKWATCNIGVSSPSDYGNYYAWGETRTKSEYTDANSVTYDLSVAELKSRGIIGTDGNLTPAYDAARANWGGTWRMPTLDEMKELNEKCTWTWTSQGGHNGYRVTGPNGKSIFLPAAGYRGNTSLYYAGSYGSYWSATPSSDGYCAYYLRFYSGLYDWYSYRRDYGRAVRPVSER